LAVARDTGRLDEHGLDVTEVPVRSSPEQFTALLGGDLDAVLTSPDNVLAYRFSPTNPLGATADVSIVSAVDRGMGLGLYGRRGFDGLRGATLGVDVPGSGFALAMYALTESLGVGRDEYRVVSLGGTPRRLTALLAGECDATMLGAGNELLAERAGCVRLASVAGDCAPYLGTVLAVAGQDRLGAARSLAHALRATAVAIRTGKADVVSVAAAQAVLDLPLDLAVRYVARLSSEEEGLVTDMDRAALATVVGLRRRFLPETVDGVDVLAHALDPTAGLIAPDALVD
jgi:hypothetical protein